MKILIIIESKHLGNTLNLAKKVVEGFDVEIKNVEEAKLADFNNYDIIGFGSGIYGSKYSSKLIKFTKKLNFNTNYTFVMSTSAGDTFEKNNSGFISILKAKGKTVLGSVSSVGYANFFPLSIFGGMNKNRPNENDIIHAKEEFALILKKYAELLK